MKDSMSWLRTNLKDSFVALLGGGGGTPENLDARIDDIRRYMLRELGDAGQKTNPKLVRTVKFAPEVQDLWYARGELMAEFAALYGEALARKKIGHVTGLFKGLLPDALNSRPTTLTRH